MCDFLKMASWFLSDTKHVHMKMGETFCLSSRYFFIIKKQNIYILFLVVLYICMVRTFPLFSLKEKVD